MEKVKTHISRSGSWGWFIFWLIVCFPIAIIYWLFKMRKTKTYAYVNKK